MFATALLLFAASTHPVDLSDPSKAVIQGIVVDESGKPAADVHISTRVWLGGLDKTNTDSDGRFRLALRDSIVGYRQVYACNADGSLRGRVQIERMSLDPVANVRITLKPSIDVRVTVVDSNGGPVAGATVAMNDGVHDLLADATTNDRGEATMNVPSDSKVGLIAAFKPGIGFEYFENYRTEAFPEIVPRQVRLALDGVRTVRAKLIDQDGKPVAGASLSPMLIGKTGKIAFVANMSFLTLVQNGQAMPKSNADGIVTFDWFPLEITRAVPMRPELEGWHNEMPVYFDRSTNDEPQPCRMTKLNSVKSGGRVTTLNGSPAAGILVQAEGLGPTGYTRAYARSGTNGRYELDLPSEKCYIVTAIDPNFATQSIVNVIIRSGQPRTDLDLKLTPGVLLEGRITAGEKRDPVADAYITLKQEGPALGDQLGEESRGKKPWLYRHAWADSTGRYRLRLSPGWYEIAGPDFKNSPLNVNSTDERVTRDFHLPRLQNGPLTVSVQNPDGTSAANCIVESTTMSDARSDEKGIAKTRRNREAGLLVVRNLTGSLATSLQLDADDDEVTAKLHPAAVAVGRVIDHQGKPCVNYTITCILTQRDEKLWARMSTYSGPGGLFVISGLPHGVTCRLQICDAMKCGVEPVKEFKVNVAGTIELGDVKLPKELK